MSNEAGLTTSVASTIADSRFEHLPETTVASVKRRILDTIGVAVPPRTLDAECARVTAHMLSAAPQGQASVIGTKRRTSASLAAFLNGFSSHALDFDDTYDEVGHHPTAQCLPAALAMAQESCASGKDLITAVAWGQDIGTRLSAARGSVARDDRQWFPITTFGPMAAATAAAKVIGLGPGQWINLFGLALHRCHGQMSAVTARESEVRAFRDSFVAQDGVAAATLADLDIQACRNGLEQLYRNYYDDDYDPSFILDGLGETFWGEKAAIKPWPCCRATHGFVDGIRTLVEDHAIAPDMIDAIILDASSFAINQLGEPAAEKRRPQKSIQAKFSLQFTAGLAAVKTPRIADFIGDALHDPLVLDMASKVETRLNPTCGKLLPTSVEIRLRDGRNLTQPRDSILGSDDRPMSDEALVEKFRDCLSYAENPLPPAALDRLVDMVLNLERVDDLSELADLLQ